jgi:protein subunit release factor A
MVDEADLRIDAYRGRGPDDLGHWGVRVTHIPSGIQADTGWQPVNGTDNAEAIARAQARLIAEIESKLDERAERS